MPSNFPSKPRPSPISLSSLAAAGAGTLLQATQLQTRPSLSEEHGPLLLHDDEEHMAPGSQAPSGSTASSSKAPLTVVKGSSSDSASDSEADGGSSTTSADERLGQEAQVQRVASAFLSASLCDNTLAEVPSSRAKVGPADFTIIKVVGQGAFGKVFQVVHKASGQVYAMKVMRKDRILEKDHGEYVKAERDVLTSVTHPYIVTLRFSFQTSSKLYLVLDFINGGHLFFNLYRQGVFSEEVARLYTAEMVSAVAYLHSLGIMHRDLKPENVLLDSQGHVKLTDFGLAKANMNNDGARSNSFIGTMEYMAPEIVEGKGHTKDVDWWSIGILLYEMLCGIPPFRAKSRNALQQQILTSKVKYPKFLSSDAQNLLKGLLARDPAKRLGHGPAGSEAIKKHPFFKAIHWPKLEARQLESKFKPVVQDPNDVTNFDKLWTDQPPEDSPCGTPAGACPEAFKGFSYVAPGFLDGKPITRQRSLGGSSGGATPVGVPVAGMAVAVAAVAAAAAVPALVVAPTTPKNRVLGFALPTPVPEQQVV